MIIELLDGTRFDIADYNLKRLFHYIPSATIEHNSVAVDGRSDVIINSKINNRTISVDFVYQSEDIFDFYLLRDEVNELFLREEEYYIIFKNEPYKRWLVKAANGYNLQPNQRLESFSIDFITLNYYAESVATTQSLKEWDIDSWGWNNSINWDNDLKYSFNANEFAINNLGNITVDPRNSFLEITITGELNGGLALTNTTTNDVYNYLGVLGEGDSLQIRGIGSYRNGVSVFSSTNKKLISLAPGINNFTLTGGRNLVVSFNFRFLYK